MSWPDDSKSQITIAKLIKRSEAVILVEKRSKSIRPFMMNWWDDTSYDQMDESNALWFNFFIKNSYSNICYYHDYNDHNPFE